MVPTSHLFWLTALITVLALPTGAVAQVAVDTAAVQQPPTVTRPGTPARDVPRRRPPLVPITPPLQPSGADNPNSPGQQSSQEPKSPARVMAGSEAIIPAPPVVAGPINSVTIPEPQLPATLRTDSIAVADTASSSAYTRALDSYYAAVRAQNLADSATTVHVVNYYEWALQNRRSIISRQQSTGTIIFIAVLLLVAAGMLFSAIQFYMAVKAAGRSGVTPDAAAPTSFKASLAGIEISSSILGVIILTVSLAFFYLYLVHVFPLTVIDR